MQHIRHIYHDAWDGENDKSKQDLYQVCNQVVQVHGLGVIKREGYHLESMSLDHLIAHLLEILL